MGFFWIEKLLRMADLVSWAYATIFAQRCFFEICCISSQQDIVWCPEPIRNLRKIFVQFAGFPPAVCIYLREFPVVCLEFSFLQVLRFAGSHLFVVMPQVPVPFLDVAVCRIAPCFLGLFVAGLCQVPRFNRRTWFLAPWFPLSCVFGPFHCGSVFGCLPCGFLAWFFCRGASLGFCIASFWS